MFRHLGDVGMVTSLESLQYIENKKLLSGHIAEILGDFNRAQVLSFIIDSEVRSGCYCFCFTFNFFNWRYVHGESLIFRAV